MDLLIEQRSNCLTLLDPSWRNWFHIFQLTSVLVIGLRKPYAKTKVGESCTCTWCLLTLDCRCVGYFFMESKYLEHISWIRILNNNRTIPLKLQVNWNKHLNWMFDWAKKGTESSRKPKYTMNAKKNIPETSQWHSREILQQAKGDSPDRVRSDQMVHGTVRRETGPCESWPKAFKTKLGQGEPSVSTPIRSDGSCDGQVEGWTFWDMAKGTQGRVKNNSRKITDLDRNWHSDSLKRFNLLFPRVRRRRELKLLMMKIMMRWEQVYHKTKCQRTLCSEELFLSTQYIWFSQHFRKVNHEGGEDIDGRHDTFSGPSWISHLPAGPQWGLQGFQ